MKTPTIDTIRATQDKKVLSWLESGLPLTAKQAADYFGIYRLAAVIHRLKKKHPIKRELKFNGSIHWASYQLIKSKP